MTLKWLLDEFDMRMGELVGGRLTPVYIKRLLNKGQKDIARKTFVLDSTYTTNSVAGTATYGFSNEFALGGIKQVSYDGTEIRPRTSPELDTSQGTPAEYYILEGTLGVYPVPDSAKVIKVLAYEIPDDMTTNGSISPIPDEWQDLILDYALWRGFQALRERDAAMEAKQQYLEGIAELQERQTEEQQHMMYEIKSTVRKIL